MVIVAEHHTKIITTIIGVLFLLTISVYSDSGLNSTDEYYAVLDKENNINIITTSIMFNTNGTEMASQLTRDKRNSSMNLINVGVVRRVHRSVSRQLTIELSVFVDYDMQIHYHYTRQNMHRYIETVLYIVAGIFRDSSVGNSIDVALVEIVQLNVELNAQAIKQSPTSSSSSNDVEGRRENVNATDLLTKFCRWQSEHRQQYAKYDTAILLTRKDLCSSSTTIEGFGCSTSGLANIGTICSQKGTSCAVIQDEGLGTAFTIAHEIGHLLSLRHDNDEECLKKKSMKESTNGFFIMNSVLGTDSNAWGWSQCSRDQLTKFLDSGSGQCLENLPQSSSKSFLVDRDDRNLEKLKLPGLVYSAVEQCQLAMGLSTPGASKPCHGGKIVDCRSMRCSREFRGQNGQVLESCRILPKPWADGTECSVSDDHADGSNLNDKEKWCIRGKCVRKMNNEDLKVVHGGWSSFSEPGPCSRTCNGGIRARVRECNNPKPKNGGRYCIGERAQYESCNTHSCGDCFSEFQFRAKQCQNYNGDNFNYPGISKNVAWVPFTNAQGNDRCKLLCIDEKTRFYHFLDRMNVIDGTKCSSVNPDAENFDMCVNGICVPAGCDHILHSTKKLDICGVCGGDNSTCTLVKGNFTNASAGTRDVVRIPAGAFSIRISQRSSIQRGTLNILPVDNNHLILFSPEDNKTLLNNPTDAIISYRKIITDLGSTFNYSGIGSFVESITTPSSPRRSINSDLIIRVHSYKQFQLSNPNITYQFYVRKSGVEKNVVCSPDAASPLLSCLYDGIKYFYLVYFVHVILNF